MEARTHLFASWRRTMRAYAFREYDGSPLEHLDLYLKKSGEEILGQIYQLEDRSGRQIALRPEMTPTLARMILSGQRHYRKPIKWFSVPQLFRYERQQKGRLREHFQLNADLIGESGPAADAEVIALLIDTLRDLGLTARDFTIRLSSRQAWTEFFVEHHGRASDQYRFFQAVDKLDRVPEEVTAQQLEPVGIPVERIRRFIREAQPTPQLIAVQDNLAARGLTEYVQIDYGIVRGLAYYDGVVFEAFDRQGEFRAIAGGGRYDGLIGKLSGGKTELPALGFGMGDVVLLELLRARKLLPEPKTGVDAYCLIEEESRRPRCLELVQRLREAGIRTDYGLSSSNSNKQFRQARELEATYLITPQGDEPPTIQLKRLADRQVETVAWADCVSVLRNRLAS